MRHLNLYMSHMIGYKWEMWQIYDIVTRKKKILVILVMLNLLDEGRVHRTAKIPIVYMWKLCGLVTVLHLITHSSDIYYLEFSHEVANLCIDDGSVVEQSGMDVTHICIERPVYNRIVWIIKSREPSQHFHCRYRLDFALGQTPNTSIALAIKLCNTFEMNRV